MTPAASMRVASDRAHEPLLPAKRAETPEFLCPNACHMLGYIILALPQSLARDLCGFLEFSVGLGIGQPRIHAISDVPEVFPSFKDAAIFQAPTKSSCGSNTVTKRKTSGRCIGAMTAAPI